MKKENVEYFVIQSVRNENTFLYSDGDEDSDGNFSFDSIDFSARISSLFGFSDDVFNDEFEPRLVIFESEEEAEYFLNSIMNDFEIEESKVVKISFGMLVG